MEAQHARHHHRDEAHRSRRNCRALAKQMSLGEQRDQLLKMAETWDVLASEREGNREEMDSDQSEFGEKPKPR
jgi:hypothetical protein